MGKIFYLIGPSASGKDSLARELLSHFRERLIPVTMSTTRPIRSGEECGRDYIFLNEEDFIRLKKEGKVIESRTYQTVYGPWTYATVDTGQIDLNKSYYLMTGTLESFRSTQAYFGKKAVIPLYIELDKGERLSRALERERRQKNPRYAEMCRRFLADEEDFSADKIEAFHFPRIFHNQDFSECLKELIGAIEKEMA